MASSKHLRQFINQLQAFHGFDIDLESRTSGPGSRIYEMHVKATGFRLQGKYAEILACAKGYQAGYLAGRRWARTEEQGLRDLITQVEAKFKVA